MAVEKSIIPVRIKNYYINNPDENTSSVKMSLMLMEALYPKSRRSGVKNIIIVTADQNKQSADAICAGPLSRKMDAPVLLVNQISNNVNSMNKEVYDFIQDCTSLTNIYVIGGPAVIGDQTIRGSSGTESDNLVRTQEYRKTQLIEEGKNGSENKASIVNNSGTSVGTFRLTSIIEGKKIVVKRIWGTNRIYTSLQVATELINRSSNNITHLFMSYAPNTMDAYILGAAACRLVQPILYFPSDDYSGISGGLDNNHISPFFTELAGKVKKVFISGGTQRVFVEQAKLLKQKLQLNIPNCIERIAGNDRYNTSLSISKEFNSLLENSQSTIVTRDNIEKKACSRLIIINGDPSVVDASVVGVYAAATLRPIICLKLTENERYLKHKNQTYNLAGYLQNKRPQLIQIFSNKPIGVSSDGTIIQQDTDAAESVLNFEALVTEYGGKITKNEAETIYDIILVNVKNFSLAETSSNNNNNNNDNNSSNNQDEHGGTWSPQH